MQPLDKPYSVYVGLLAAAACVHACTHVYVREGDSSWCLCVHLCVCVGDRTVFN